MGAAIAPAQNGMELAETSGTVAVAPGIPQRIQVMRTVLIAAIVVLHAPPVVSLGGILWEPSDLLGTYLQNGLLRAAVPLLTAISGYLLFRSGLDRRPGELLARKSRTLLLPFLLWNLPLAAAVAWAQAHGALGGQRLYLGSGDPAAWADAVLALTGHPVNYPLHFLRDLFVLSLLAVAIGPVLRRWPLATLLAVLAAFVTFDLDGLLVLRTDMPLMFFAGAVAAVRGADLRVLDAQAVPLFAVFTLVAAVHVAVGETDHSLVLRVIGVLSLWPLSAGIAASALGPWLARQSRHAFFVFAAHAPLLEVLYLAWGRLTARLPGMLPDQIFWVAGPLAAILIAVATHTALAALLPGLAALLTGGRTRDGDAPARRQPELAPVPAADAAGG